MMEDVAFENRPLSPGVLVGDGTIAYPLNPTEVDVAKLADTVSETTLGKPGRWFKEAVAPLPGISGLLDAWGRPADGCVRE